MRLWGVVLDADVLLRSSARDLFLYLAALGAVEPIWSEQILGEVARNFPTGRERFGGLRSALELTFPTARKSGFEYRIGTLALTSESDRHVLALAGEYEADVISFNHRHYDPTEAHHFGISVWHPDDALDHLVNHHGAQVERAARRAYLMLRKPPVMWVVHRTYPGGRDAQGRELARHSAGACSPIGRTLRTTHRTVTDQRVSRRGAGSKRRRVGAGAGGSYDEVQAPEMDEDDLPGERVAGGGFVRTSSKGPHWKQPGCPHLPFPLHFGAPGRAERCGGMAAVYSVTAPGRGRLSGRERHRRANPLPRRRLQVHRPRLRPLG